MIEKPSVVDPQKLIGTTKDIGTIILTSKDASLYAVGIGFNIDPMRQEDYKYTNEKGSKFTTFPTITAVMRLKLNLLVLIQSPYIPVFGIHQLLHAQEKLYMVHPRIQIGAEYRQTVEVIDAVDKGKNGFFTLRHSAFIKSSKGAEQLAFYVDRTMFIRGLGGFGFKGTSKLANIPPVPKRQPDYVFKDSTFPSQAFIYRLSDDDNILHIDPEVAKKAGFERPIIHGMASYGTVARCLVQNLLGNNSDELKSYEVRLVGHVFPGESFEIRVWKEGSKFYFDVEVVERKTKALVGVLTARERAKM